MSLLSGINDLILAPFGGAPETPKVNATAIDPETQALINRQVDRAKRSNADFAADEMAGVKDAGGVFDPNSAGAAEADDRRRASLGSDGGERANFDAAIRRKAGQAYQGDINKIERSAQMGAYQKKSQALTQASNVLTAQNNYNQNLTKLNWQAEADAKAARAGAISSILGIAGTVVGGIYGGAGGAKAGNAAGTAGGGIMAGAE